MLGKSSYASKGLRPSHAFCNQVKSDIVFLSPPTTKSGISVSTRNIELYTRRYKAKLNGEKPEEGEDKGRSFIRSLEPLFCTDKDIIDDMQYESINGFSRQEFADKVEKNIPDFLQEICDKWNKISGIEGVGNITYTGDLSLIHI